MYMEYIHRCETGEQAERRTEDTTAYKEAHQTPSHTVQAQSDDDNDDGERDEHIPRSTQAKAKFSTLRVHFRAVEEFA